MMLAEALMRKHLPAEWTWNSDSKNTRYMTILSKFLDLKDSPYSIHRIAAQGTDFSRKIGEWFGPNTIAHVLKKLTDLDSWSQIGVVVATDMAVIMKELGT
jgi:cysteine protease ATG4